MASALRKQMARSPIPDSEILSSLVWVSEMINAIITGSDNVPLALSADERKAIAELSAEYDRPIPYEDTPLPE